MDEGPDDDGTRIKWKVDDDGVLMISGNGNMESYRGLTKEGGDGVHPPWWNKRDKIYSITINDGISSIGDCAFYTCTNLTSVTIPDSVTMIGIYAFYGCSSLTGVIIPDSMTIIGDCAFFGCSRLTSAEIPTGASYVENGEYPSFPPHTQIIRRPPPTE